MTRLSILFFLVLAILLSACVDPSINENHLLIELNATQEVVFPGSQITVKATITDQFNNTADAKLSWMSNIPEATIVDQQAQSATFHLPGSVGDTAEFTVTLTASTSEAEAMASFNINIGAEPFIVIDTKETVTDGYWLLGVHSAKRIDLKGGDTLYSDNRLLTVSPNSQYLFMSRYLKNGDYLHSIYDANTNTHVSISGISSMIEVNKSFWSPDSQHLILLSQTEAFTLSMERIAGSAIQAISHSGSFDNVIWNNSTTAQPLAVAALTSNSSVFIYYVESNILREVAMDFGSINEDSLTWHLDRLLLIANTTTLTSHQVYNINPSSIDGEEKPKVLRMTGGISPTNSVSVDRFSATAVTDFSYIRRTQQDSEIYFNLVDIKGGNESSGVSSFSSAELDSSILTWSADGTLLAVLAPLSNSLALYDRNLSELAVLTLDDVNNRSNYQLFWLGNPQKLVVVSSVDNQRSIISIDPLNTTSFSEQKYAKFAASISSSTASSMNLAIESQTQDNLLLLPVASESGEHNNLATVDANNSSLNILVSLQETLLKPLSPGNFTQTSGIAADEVHSVTQTLIELSDGTVVSAVLSADGNKIVDVIATHINGNDVMARSLIEDITVFESIRRIVGP